MCILTSHIDKDVIQGYKVVAKKGDNYYSLAMGFRYYESKDILHVKRQRRLCNYYLNDILKVFYIKEMIGRTACFESLPDTVEYYTRIMKSSSNKTQRQAQYQPIIVQVELSKDLMVGFLEFASHPYKVYAGRRIKFLKEIQYPEGDSYANK